MAKTAVRNGTAKRAAKRAERASRREEILDRWQSRARVNECRRVMAEAKYESRRHRDGAVAIAVQFVDPLELTDSIPTEWRTVFIYHLLRLVQLKEMDYQDYLQTEEWKTKAAEAKAAYQGQCALDSTHPAEHAHHRTYKRLGRELPDDLIPLCSDCHAKFHNKR